MKKYIRYEQVMYDCEDISFTNEIMMHMIKSVVDNAKFEGIKILFGGDMNAHIWDLDRCEKGF